MSTRAIRLEETIKATVIYDNFVSAVSAKTLLEHAALSADEAVPWVISPWRVDVLQHGTIAREALADAADAALVAVAISITRIQPSWLTPWVESWAECRRHPDAALAVVSVGATALKKAAPFLGVLRGLAERHHLTFFVCGEAEGAGAFDQNLRQQEQLIIPALPELVEQTARMTPYSRWGLNE